LTESTKKLVTEVDQPLKALDGRNDTLGSAILELHIQNPVMSQIIALHLLPPSNFNTRKSKECDIKEAYNQMKERTCENCRDDANDDDRS
jgi:hypothetical protein